jgi:hypothetical protein
VKGGICLRTWSDDGGELLELRSADFDFANLEEAGEKLD